MSTNASICIKIPLETIHALLVDNRFRKQLGMDSWPTDRQSLREKIEKMKEQGQSYGQIVQHMENNFIPTMTGLRKWRKSSINRTFATSGSTTDAIVPQDDLLTAFRDFIVQQMLGKVGEPLEMLKYEVRATEVDGAVEITSLEMPSAYEISQRMQSFLEIQN